MSQPTLITKSQTFVKQKNLKTLKKTVWEYNTGQFDDVDIAATSIQGIYPISGWASNKKVTMLCYVLKGQSTIEIEKDKSYQLKSTDVFIIPPKTWYKLSGKFEALMICSPAWYESQYKLN